MSFGIATLQLGTNYAWLAGAATVVLISLLILRVLITELPSDRASQLRHVLNILITPLLIVFIVNVVFKISSMLNRT